MKEGEARPLKISVGEAGSVSALWLGPARARACYVFAHGAGAGMTHPSMAAFAEGLAAREVATLRFQFAYMEQGSKRPDPPAVAQAAVRAAVDEAARLGAGLPLFAGGRSFGGRMTSQAQAKSPLPGVRGLVFVGFPLHPAGTPGTERAAHLSTIDIPMLFLQGTRDELAEPRPAQAGGRCARRERDPRAVRRRRPLVPRPGAQRPQRCAGARGDARCHGGLDGDARERLSVTIERAMRHPRAARMPPSSAARSAT